MFLCREGLGLDQYKKYDPKVSTIELNVTDS